MTRDEQQEMTRRLKREGLIRPNTAAQFAEVEPAVIWRWIVKGVRGVKLEATQGPGNGWFTSKEAILRFFAARSSIERTRLSQAESPTRKQAAKGLTEFQEAIAGLRAAKTKVAQ
ncbi:hypothetical protein KIH39_26355 [Telmatocola sphagniphila]|uniref:DUF1580 domain-containing protein n=1 Tax=Telmatocola sphagniphila TaxID=1123043 RepID=A0A8E6B6K7_9BACT|nr:hypothetical protein [Telmatocola sphagniphila]QVL32312.1 hypothetical protein KIH39_26355 [Telmatocola sphagniphila]